MWMKWTSIFEAYSSEQISYSNWIEVRRFSSSERFLSLKISFFVCECVFMNRLDARLYIQYVRVRENIFTTAYYRVHIECVCHSHSHMQSWSWMNSNSFCYTHCVILSLFEQQHIISNEHEGYFIERTAYTRIDKRNQKKN